MFIRVNLVSPGGTLVSWLPFKSNETTGVVIGILLMIVAILSLPVFLLEQSIVSESIVSGLQTHGAISAAYNGHLQMGGVSDDVFVPSKQNTVPHLTKSCNGPTDGYQSKLPQLVAVQSYTPVLYTHVN